MAPGCRSLEQSVERFNLVNTSLQSLPHTPTESLLQHKEANFLWTFSSLDEFVDVMEFQATDASSSMSRTREIYKAQSLCVVEKKEVIYRIESNIFKPWDNR
jgi:hypothetical protein